MVVLYFRSSSSPSDQLHGLVDWRLFVFLWDYVYQLTTWSPPSTSHSTYAWHTDSVDMKYDAPRTLCVAGFWHRPSELFLYDPCSCIIWTGVFDLLLHFVRCCQGSYEAFDSIDHWAVVWFCWSSCREHCYDMFLDYNFRDMCWGSLLCIYDRDPNCD